MSPRWAGRLDVAQQRWLATHWRVERLTTAEEAASDGGQRLSREDDERWTELRRLLDDRRTASFPRELRALGPLLAALFVAGCFMPLVLLGSPDNATQVTVAAPTTLLVGTVGMLMHRRVASAFRRWADSTVYSRVDGEYEMELLNEKEYARRRDEAARSAGS